MLKDEKIKTAARNNAAKKMQRNNTSKQALVEETAVVAGKSHFYTNLMSLQSERDEEKVEETAQKEDFHAKTITQWKNLSKQLELSDDDFDDLD